MVSARKASIVSAVLIGLAVALVAPPAPALHDVHADVHVLSNEQLVDLLRR